VSICLEDRAHRAFSPLPSGPKTARYGGPSRSGEDFWLINSEGEFDALPFIPPRSRGEAAAERVASGYLMAASSALNNSRVRLWASARTISPESTFLRNDF